MSTKRENWFNAALPLLKERVFMPEGLKVPDNVRIGVGTLSSRSGKSNSTNIGVCFPAERSESNTIEIFISPELDDSNRVLDVVCHELIHAIDGNQNGHKGPFRTMALAIGLEGKMTSTTASERLNGTLSEIVKEIGEYPHEKLDTSRQKKQGTRMLKMECSECGWNFRTNKTQLAAMTINTCLSCQGDTLELA